MIRFRTLVGSATALALATIAVSPAAARPYWGGGRGYYGGHHHRGGGDTFGNILLGGVIAGGLIAVVSAANKDKNRAVASRRGVDQNDDLRESGSDAREVASICTSAVENMARGRITSVDSVDRDGEGWRVDGVVDVERDGDRNFFCNVRDGRIETVQLSSRDADREFSNRDLSQQDVSRDKPRRTIR